MNIEAAYNFLHKQIRNVVPTKHLQRRCIEGLRRTLFKEVLADCKILVEAAVIDGTAEKFHLCPAHQTPASDLVRETGDVPEALRIPASGTPELFRYVFEDGLVFRRFVLDKKRRFILDATPPGLFADDLYRQNIDIRAFRPERIEAEAIALNAGYSDNYYHWFADLIGRMLLMPDWRSGYICADLRYPYQRETFRYLGIPESRLVPFSDYRLLQFAKLHVVTVPHLFCRHSFLALQAFAEGVGAMQSEGHDRLRLEKIPAGPAREEPRRKDEGTRLYISRKDVRKRRGIANEEELLPMLEEHGFTRVIFSGMPVAEQIAILREARCVIFPQGAAAVNMLFCKPDTVFLEFYSPHYLDPTGAQISRATGLEHHILLGESGPGASVKSDYFVDEKVLLRAIELLVS